ncbi:hypothetical protein RUM44_013869 [Polyplax serrata]|uniref:Uncharacterized protein n=1 Tax=Polyplax serrata TaxID=468196 RepID=A0ABR1BFD9_POLSC
MASKGIGKKKPPEMNQEKSMNLSGRVGLKKAKQQRKPLEEVTKRLPQRTVRKPKAQTGCHRMKSNLNLSFKLEESIESAKLIVFVKGIESNKNTILLKAMLNNNYKKVISLGIEMSLLAIFFLPATLRG